MTEEELKKLKGAVRRYPKTIIGFNSLGRPVVTVHPSRAAVAGLKNFMPDTIMQVLQGSVSNPQEAEKLEEAIKLIRALSDHGSVSFLPIRK